MLAHYQRIEWFTINDGFAIVILICYNSKFFVYFSIDNVRSLHTVLNT